MAQITSILSGNWSNPAIWDSASVPDPSADDVFIASGCAITLPAGTSVRFTGNRTLEVESTASLTVAGELTIDSSSNGVFYGDFTVAEGGAVHVSVNSSLVLNGSALIATGGAIDLYQYSNLVVQTGVTLTVLGTLQVTYWCYVNVYGTLNLEVGGWMDLYDWGYCYIDSGGLGTIRGNVTASYYAMLQSSYYSLLVIEPVGVVDIQGSGMFSVEYYGRADVRGTLVVGTGSYFNVGEGAELRMSKSIVVDGYIYLTSYLRLPRREITLVDSSGVPRIGTNQTYGYGQTKVA